MYFFIQRAGPRRMPQRQPKVGKLLRYLAIGMSATWLTACASNISVPLAGTDHPANPQAQEAPEPPRSTALDTKVIAAPKPAPAGHDMHQHR
jgi:hypothetical protein